MDDISSHSLSINPSQVSNVIQIDYANLPNEGGQARSSNSAHPMETIRLNVEPLRVRPLQDWPDEMEQLKRIQRNDGERTQNELKYIANK
jgi:hypothetical protein